MNETTNIPEPSRRDDRSRRLADRFKFRRVNEITGTFVLVVLAVLIAAVVWTGRSQRWFKSNVTLRIILPADGAAGIRQGSEVYFLGTLVGTVSDVAVDEKGRMDAEANIRRDFFRFVRADSSAVVKKKFGVAGDSFFEITRGVGQPLPVKDASIVCKEQFQSALEAAVEEVRREAMLMLKKVNGGLDTWTTLGSNLITTRARLDQLVGRMDDLATGVQAGKGTVGKLLTDTAVVDEAQKLLARASEAMSELQGVVTNLNVAVKNVRNGTARLPEITGAVADEAKDLPGLVLQTQTSMRELERLIEAMQRHWLLRKYVNKTNPPSLNPLSEPAVPEKKPVKMLRSPGDSMR
ncbi:MAG: MlaD family protein [Verrucomicrobia bacterium]|jgi:phospholipid/cholesterol/gamma-HCH transport system substrate-binding protein|nr:MlaD family protein [Verrucomicrobiota bacterium]